jgi:hypothetical protein
MDPVFEHLQLLSRRQFFGKTRLGLGLAALATMGGGRAAGAVPEASGPSLHGVHIPAKAKRVIYMFQNGGPSQLDLFDPKPVMRDMQGADLPESVRMGQRLTGMTSGQAKFPLAASMFKFAQYGQSGHWLSELLPHTASVADDLCFIHSVHTEAINHDPGITYMQTGHQQPGRPSFGAWVSYGLGSLNSELPAFVVLISQGSNRASPQPLFQRLWGSGFLPSQHQGVNFRAGSDPVLYLNNPPGIDQSSRREWLDGLSALNEMHYNDFGDPEINTRISQYEMAYKMQTSVPDLMDISDEPESTFELYGEDARKPGTYAANCLLARRLAERDVRFIQIYHRGWDQHGDLPTALPLQCKDTDQGSAALVKDLKQRGLLDDTLVIWAGEFGRTVYCQGELTPTNYGRDHHGRCFTIWMAGAGVKPGFSYGATDDFGYNITENPVHVHDLNATMMHQLGVDHERLTYRFQGRDFRLTDVHGKVVRDILV